MTILKHCDVRTLFVLGIYHLLSCVCLQWPVREGLTSSATGAYTVDQMRQTWTNRQRLRNPRNYGEEYSLYGAHARKHDPPVFSTEVIVIAVTSSCVVTNSTTPLTEIDLRQGSRCDCDEAIYKAGTGKPRFRQAKRRDADAVVEQSAVLGLRERSVCTGQASRRQHGVQREQRGGLVPGRTLQSS